MRRDIEGLRAIAVVSVVLYHAGAPGFSGGFTGVDVFFVISGFLITQMFCREVDATGRIDILGFYARRVRRLLPAAVLVAMTTFAVSRFLISPIALLNLRWDAISSVANVSNYWLAFRNTQYLGAHTGASSYQQYWSLAVEEQFYLAWPLLLAVAIWMFGGRRFQSASRVLISIILITSFVTCFVVTKSDQPWAFFSLPTRAWELAIGALVAVSTRRERPYQKRVNLLAGYLGLITIGMSILLISGEVGFPGWIAACPVLGAALIIGSGGSSSNSFLDAVLGNVAFTWIGRISYSLYLWHWPIFVLGADIKGSTLGWLDYGLLIPLSVLAAWLTYRYVENPLRHASWLSARPVRSLSAGAVGSLCAVALVVALAVPPTLHTDDAVDPPTISTAGLEPATLFVPRNLKPDLLTAGDHFPLIFSDGCHHGFKDVAVHDCVYGTPASRRVVVLFGDSHAAQWFPALHRVALEDGLRLISLTKSGCPSAIVKKNSTYLGRRYIECDIWREAAFERIRSERPSLVVMANSTNATDDPTRVPTAEWLGGMSATLDRLADVPRVTVISDTPYSRVDVPTCLSGHVNSASACAIPRPDAIDDAAARAQASVVRRHGRQMLDFNGYLCTSSACPAIVGNILVYLDKHHLSPDMAEELSRVMQRHVHRTLRAFV